MPCFRRASLNSGLGWRAETRSTAGFDLMSYFKLESQADRSGTLGASLMSFSARHLESPLK